MIRVYELTQAHDGLGGVCEDRVLIYEGRGKLVKKKTQLEHSPYHYEDQVFEVFLPKHLILNSENKYEMEVE